MNADHLELKTEIAAKYSELSQRISRLEALVNQDADDEHRGDAQFHEGRPE